MNKQFITKLIDVDIFCKLWIFSDAPMVYKELSQHGGDEDWVIFAPTGFDAGYLVDRLTVCDYQEYPIDGGIVYITAHA